MATPLGLARRNKLIDNYLRTVGKVTKLCLPNCQYIGLGCGIAILKSQYSLFGKHRVNHCKAGLVFSYVLQGDVIAIIPTLAELIMQHRVAMRKSTPA